MCKTLEGAKRWRCRVIGMAASSIDGLNTTPAMVYVKKAVFLALVTALLCARGADAIRCYQCSSENSPKDKDTCGVYKGFDTESNFPVECQGEESVTPGTFCVKITQQSPRGFIWDGRWRQVIRRCASVSDTGVTGVCNWGIYDNGVYWEECYCSEDACNRSHSHKSSLIQGFFAAFVLLWWI